MSHHYQYHTCTPLWYLSHHIIITPVHHCQCTTPVSSHQYHTCTPLSVHLSHHISTTPIHHCQYTTPVTSHQYHTCTALSVSIRHLSYNYQYDTPVTLSVHHTCHHTCHTTVTAPHLVAGLSTYKKQVVIMNPGWPASCVYSQALLVPGPKGGWRLGRGQVPLYLVHSPFPCHPYRRAAPSWEKPIPATSCR